MGFLDLFRKKSKADGKNAFNGLEIVDVIHASDIPFCTIDGIKMRQPASVYFDGYGPSIYEIDGREHGIAHILLFFQGFVVVETNTDDDTAKQFIVLGAKSSKDRMQDFIRQQEVSATITAILAMLESELWEMICLAHWNDFFQKNMNQAIDILKQKYNCEDKPTFTGSGTKISNIEALGKEVEAFREKQKLRHRSDEP